MSSNALSRNSKPDLQYCPLLTLIQASKLFLLYRSAQLSEVTNTKFSICLAMYIKGWLAAKSILKYLGVKAAEISSSSTAVSMEKLNDKSLPKAKSTSILDLSLPFAFEAISRLKVSR